MRQVRRPRSVSGDLICGNGLPAVGFARTPFSRYSRNVESRDQRRPRSATTASVIRALTVAALLGGAIACGGTQIPKAQSASPAQSLFNGQVRADINCYHCHDGDGSGTLWGPNLAKRVPQLTDDGIAQAIAEGPGLMPSFKGKLSDAEVKEIVAWLRSKFPR